jgi:N-methylhydantoinase B
VRPSHRRARIEIVAGALEAATAEMCASLIRSAYSPNIKERADCSTAICDMQGRTLSIATHAPAHLGSTLKLVPALLERFPIKTLAPGDVFFANDPYIVGVTHLNDCTAAAPIFIADKVVAFALAVAHHSDVGGRVPGSESGDSTSIFQDGVRLPPMRLVANGIRRDDVWEMFLLNSRTPHFSNGDLLAQLAALERGRIRVEEIYARYGLEETSSAIERVLDATEKRMRSRIGEVLRAGTLKAVVDPSIANNEGVYRVIRLNAPAGSIVNPLPPAAVGSRNPTAMILADVLLRALGQAAPARAIAASGNMQGTILAGWDAARGRYFVNYENFAGGQGALPTRDGDDAMHVSMSNTSNLPIEAMEMEFPLRAERYELIPGSGGSGRQRGGLGVCRDYRIIGDGVELATRSTRQRFAAQGLDGGGSGALGAFIVDPDTPQEQKLPGTGSEIALRNGALLRIETAGGGGYGDAAERDPDQITADRRGGKVL